MGTGLFWLTVLQIALHVCQHHCVWVVSISCWKHRVEQLPHVMAWREGGGRERSVLIVPPKAFTQWSNFSKSGPTSWNYFPVTPWTGDQAFDTWAFGRHFRFKLQPLCYSSDYWGSFICTYEGPWESPCSYLRHKSMAFHTKVLKCLSKRKPRNFLFKIFFYIYL